MKNKITVLITSAGVGSAINIIKAFSKQNEISIHVIAVDQDPLSAGLFMADQSFVSPPVDDSKCYIDFLLSISKKFHVDALFPCHSSEISLIADNQDLLKNNGIQTLISKSEVINLCNDKVRMKKRVNALGIKTPKTLHNPVCSDIPCFTKLNSSSSSKGAQLIDNEHLLAHFRKDKIQRIYETYIEGEEYTVDILCDRNSRVLTACPRHRISTKAGQSVKGRIANKPKMCKLAHKICEHLEVVGACNIQFIENKDGIYFIELNPRFAAGGLMLTVNAGANIPLMALKIMLKQKVKPFLNFDSDMMMTRYWEEIITTCTSSND